MSNANRNTRPTCIDVFSGIGGISLALSPFVQTVLYCEVNKYCQQVLTARMASNQLERAPIHGDIQTLFLDSVQPTMLVGGFPCTDISSMGLKRGISTETRSGLFLEIIRLVDENPSIKVLFLENVSNITKCGLKEVVAELSSRGFQFCWKLRSASSMGAPHLRNRWFCLAVRDNYELNIIESNECASELIPDWTCVPDRRFAFRPIHSEDTLFDPNWNYRCQTLGNTVVPCVVRQSFVELVRIQRNVASFTDCFDGIPVTHLQELDSLPEAGLVVGNTFYHLPVAKTGLIPEGGIPQPLATMKFRDSLHTLQKLPTPRHGLTYPSSVTERSIKELPTILVHCEETREALAESATETETDANTLHTILTPNVNFIEWMMGYPRDWTKIENNNASIQRPVTPPKNAGKSSRYNGMHVFMKEHPGKSIIQIAKLWKALDADTKYDYTQRAKTGNHP
jgi:DNA (cytosine-5)-methyltransferase 1